MPFGLFFDQVENEPKFAKCKFCGDKLSLGSENTKNQTTTSLKRHIRAKHAKQWPGKLHLKCKLNLILEQKIFKVYITWPRGF